MDAIAAEVARDIRNQYTVAYKPDKASHPHEYREVHVEAHAPHAGRLTVRTRKGYVIRDTSQSKHP